MPQIRRSLLPVYAQALETNRQKTVARYRGKVTLKVCASAYVDLISMREWPDGPMIFDIPIKCDDRSIKF